jgi:uncharacterized protein
MTDSLLLLAAVTAVAAFVQGAIGIGFALILAPVMAFMAPDLVPGGILLLMLPLNAFVAWREREHLVRRDIGWITLGRAAGAVAGFAVLAAVAGPTLNLLVGAATLLAAAASLAAPRFTPDRRGLVVAGVVTGITETATGVGGPPLALVYQHRSASALRANVAACFFVGEILSLTLLSATGRLELRHAETGLLLVPALAAGVFASRFAHASVGGKRMRTAVLGFAAASGVVLMLWR